MRVAHIIPSAFNYFDDIRSVAFQTVDYLDKETSLEVEAFTLQYNEPSSKLKQEIQTKAPHRNYQGVVAFNEVLSRLDSYELVHLHAPFLGGARKLVAWKKEHPDIPLVISYYRKVYYQDIISVYLQWYNAFYLPKLLREAGGILCFSSLPKVWFIKSTARVVDGREVCGLEKEPLTFSFDSLQLPELERLGKFLVKLYNNVV